MRLTAVIPLLLAVASTASAQLRDPEDLLLQSRDKIQVRTEHLPNYTCVQTVDRQYFKPEKPEYPVPSCDNMLAKRTGKKHRLKLVATDRLRLDVKVSGGTEIGSWAGASHFEDGNVMKLIQGPFGTGPFGTFLSDIFLGTDVRFYFEGEETMESYKVFKYRFQVDLDASHYMVHAGAEWLYTAYDGAVWIDAKSLELRRLMVRTSELPAETTACESSTAVDYASMHIGTGDFLLPQHSSLHFLMRDMGESDVAITYSGCHQFHGEATLVTEPRETSGELSPAPRPPITFPAKLAVRLKLAQPIDTDTAAAGDVVLATISEAVRDPKSGEIVMEGGAKVRGRILLMRHVLGARRSFEIAIQLETVEIHGVAAPLYAVRPSDYEDWVAGAGRSELVELGGPVFLPPLGQSRRAVNFSFVTKAKHHVMPRGYETKWVTVVAPDSPKQ